MTYRQTLQISFDAASFLVTRPHARSSPPVQTNPESSSPITLVYIADKHPFHPVPLTTERRFFLNLIREGFQSLQPNRTKVKDMFTFIQKTWSLADTIAEETRILNLSHITTSTILSETVLTVQATLILPALERKTKVEVQFLVDVSHSSSRRDGGGGGGGCLSGLDGVLARVESKARVVYGEKFNEEKMGEFLRGRIADAVTGEAENVESKGSWAVAVRELTGRLGVGRGKG